MHTSDKFAARIPYSWLTSSERIFVRIVDKNSSTGNALNLKTETIHLSDYNSHRNLEKKLDYTAVFCFKNIAK